MVCLAPGLHPLEIEKVVDEMGQAHGFVMDDGQKLTLLIWGEFAGE